MLYYLLLVTVLNLDIMSRYSLNFLHRYLLLPLLLLPQSLCGQRPAIVCGGSGPEVGQEPGRALDQARHRSDHESRQLEDNYVILCIIWILYYQTLTSPSVIIITSFRSIIICFVIVSFIGAFYNII